MRGTKMQRPNIALGDKAECQVTGFKGIVTAISDYIDGCRQVCLTPKVGKDGQVMESHWFDIERLKVKKQSAINLNSQPTGGPQPSPPTRWTERADLMLQCPENSSLQCSGAREGKGCCKITPPGPHSFSVNRRNPHHWDIYTDWGRAFRIRGEPGAVWVADEREMKTLPPLRNRQVINFRTVGAAMLWISEELLTEQPE